jgi:hypothetical protein
MSDEYVIAHTQATALIVASLIRSKELPRLYSDSIEAIKAYYDQPKIMQQRYHLFKCDTHGAATVMADPKVLKQPGRNAIADMSSLSQEEIDDIVGIARRFAPEARS